MPDTTDTAAAVKEMVAFTPVTVTITSEWELTGLLKARCFHLVVEISNLSHDVTLGNLIGDTEGLEAFQEVTRQLETAKAALEAIHAQ